MTYAVNTDALSSRALELLNEKAGFTLNLRGETPTSGFAVGGFSPEVVHASPMPAEWMRRLTTAWVKLLSRGFYLGGWRNDGTDTVELVRVFENRFEAIATAVALKQQAIYDLESKQVIFFH